MKSLGVLFLLILLVGVSVSSQVQALQVDCPFPEGTVEWQEAGKKYVCTFAAVAPVQSPAVKSVCCAIVQQTPSIIVQTIPVYPYPFWGPLWGRQSLFYPDAYGYGWRPYLW